MMRNIVQLVLCGILPLEAHGVLLIAKEPPFPAILTPGWAATVTIEVERDLPHISRILDLMRRHPAQSAPTIVGCRDRWITGDASCVDRTPRRGSMVYTLAFARFMWSNPLRVHDLREHWSGDRRRTHDLQAVSHPLQPGRGRSGDRSRRSRGAT